MKLIDIVKINEEQGKEIYLNESIVKDGDTVRDIYLTLENNYKTFQELEAYKSTIQRKINKDIFNYGLALKGIRTIIDKNIKSEYINPYCNNNTKLENFICIDDRIYLYIYFLESLLEDLREEI